MPSEGSDSPEVEPSSFSKVKSKVYNSTRKANHAALHRAWTLYYIITGILFGTLAVSLIVSIFVAFDVSQTSELGFVLICIILESIYIIGHVSLTWFRTHALCFTGMLINFGICLYMIVFMILVIVQTKGFNPLENLMGFAFLLTVLHCLSYLADLNLLRFLHFKQNHWLGKRLFGSFARRKNAQPEAPSPPELPEYSMTVKEDTTEGSSNESVKRPVSKSQDQRVSAGVDQIQTVGHYPADKNPFTDSDAIGASTNNSPMPSQMARTDPFDTEYALSEGASSGPASEYLIDCQDIIPEPTAVFTDLDRPQYRYFGGGRGFPAAQMIKTPVQSRAKQMEYVAEIENQVHFMPKYNYLLYQTR
uniref:MARVEL domain-containing protein n=1 Tax=Panagrellus redivivus TaxID=6233 RepID=A0A7E4VYG2_PANRE